MNGEMVNYVPMKSGMRIDLAAPDPDTIRLSDIAFGLAGINRFAGQTRSTVAQHSVIVGRWLGFREGGQRLMILGLLHDAHEACTGYNVRPMKARHPGISHDEAAVQAAILKAFRIAPPSPEEEQLVKYYDEIYLATEARDLFRASPQEFGLQAGPDMDRLVIWSPRLARQAFLDMAAELSLV